MFLNLFCCRDRDKFVRLSKEVDELKSEVKKLRRRVRSLEKKKKPVIHQRIPLMMKSWTFHTQGQLIYQSWPAPAKNSQKRQMLSHSYLILFFLKMRLKTLPFLAKELLNAGRRDPALLLTRLDSGFWRELFLKPFQISQGKTYVKKFRTCKKLRESVNYVVKLKRKE